VRPYLVFGSLEIGHASVKNTVIYAQLTSRRRDEEARKIFLSPQVVCGVGSRLSRCYRDQLCRLPCLQYQPHPTEEGHGKIEILGKSDTKLYKKNAATSTAGSEIQRTLGLFDGSTLYGVGIDHGGPDIRVSEQFLNSADIIIGLQEMGGKAVAEGMS